MKKLLTILFVLISFIAKAQPSSTSSQVRFPAVWVQFRDTATARPSDTACIFYFNNNFWVKRNSSTFFQNIFDGSGTVTSIATNNGTGITGGTITASGTLVIDTINISTRAWRQKGIDSTIGLIALKVNISDTSAMLVPYLRKSDTLFMLSPYLRKSDTLIMLSPYLRKTDTANALLPYLRKTDTASMLSPYALKSSGNDFIRNQTGSNLSAQTAKALITDTLATQTVVYALGSIKSDGIVTAGGNGFVADGTGLDGGVLNLKQSSSQSFQGLGYTSVFSQGTDTVGFRLATTGVSNRGFRFTASNIPSGTTRYFALQNASGTLALTSNVTDSASALRSSINTKLNISDTAAMKATQTFDRILANGNTTGRSFTAGGATLTGALAGTTANFSSTGGFGGKVTVTGGNVRLSNAFFLSGNLVAGTETPIVGFNASDKVSIDPSGFGIVTGGGTVTLGGALTGTSGTFSAGVTANQLTASNTAPQLDLTFSSNTNFKHSIVGSEYSSTASLNKMTFKVANASASQIDVMTLNGGGNVGIGTTSPTDKLEVQDGYISTYHANATQGAGYYIRSYTNTTGSTKATIGQFGVLQNTTNTRAGYFFIDLSNGGAPSEKLRLLPSGRLLVNTTTDDGSSIIQANGNVTVNNILTVSNGTLGIVTSGAANRFVLQTNGINRFDANSTQTEIADQTGSTFLTIKSGNVGIVTTSPVTPLDVNGAATVRGKIYARDVATGSGTDSVLVKANDGEIKKVAQSSLGGGTGTTYVPTYTGIANVLTIGSAVNATYTRVGNVVTVFGFINISTSASGNTTLSISLPVASNFANTYDASGVGYSSGISSFVNANTSNDNVEFNFLATSSASYTLYYSFQYIVN